MSESPPGSDQPQEPEQPQQPQQSAWSWWRGLGHSTWLGLIVLGAFNGLANEELTALVVTPGLTGPAPGHPERAVPWLPPTPEERSLWDRLTS
ncbi:DUF6059 family protein [Kitasatospora sp. McL0602]|uniref:DUF6059 family protein n=1 Tax=Kitasatospora sp. McL0602 TaxID=3439530 RepID=UPI003F8AEF64